MLVIYVVERLIMHVNYEKSHPYFNDFRLKLAVQELVRMALELYYFCIRASVSCSDRL